MRSSAPWQTLPPTRRKDKPEKMNENEEANLRQAKTQLEESANHLMVLYTSEQGTDGTNNAL